MTSMGKKVVIAGGTGLVGAACAEHFAKSPATTVISLSRRLSPDQSPGEHHMLDLNDPAGCRRFAEMNADTTHLVYAAVQEQDSLVSGWSDQRQIDANDRMFRNLVDPLTETARDLRHIVLLQGTKAYGAHVREIESPAREGRSEMREQPNFYWRQEDHLRAISPDADWSWTIFRPVHIFGNAVGSSLNPLAAIGVYGAILAELGSPLVFPGGAPRISQAIDVGILAAAIDWAGENTSARNEIFNIANGDVFSWQNVWPSIAAELGMEVGQPKPASVAEFMRDKAAVWDRIRARHDLLSPGLEQFVGRSFQFLDYTFRHGRTDAQTCLVSTVKLHSAGFNVEIDTEQMFANWFNVLRDQRMLPPRSRG